jgi:hypothetical protein
MRAAEVAHLQGPSLEEEVEGRRPQHFQRHISPLAERAADGVVHGLEARTLLSLVPMEVAVQSSVQEAKVKEEVVVRPLVAVAHQVARAEPAAQAVQTALERRGQQLTRIATVSEAAHRLARAETAITVTAIGRTLVTEEMVLVEQVEE